jgi:ribosomal protein S18 acetylase RimI-like enzyme
MDPASHRGIIRPAVAADLPRLREIQAASPEASPWNPLDYDCLVEVGQAPGLPSGFLVSRQITPGEREILNVAVDPSNRRQGIARKLVEAELARSKGTWFLEVRESNAAAIALYQCAGFKAAGRRPGYYSDPPEAAIVMRFLS